MQTLYYISVFIHILSAAIWIGGMFFLALVIVPVFRNPLFHKFSAQIFHESGIRFRNIGWICLGLFLVSGFFNLYFRMQTLEPLLTLVFWQDVFDGLLFYKLILFAFILFLSALHDFYIGPKATKVWQTAPDSVEAKKRRKSASWFGRVNLLLGLIVVFLAIAMVRGGFS